MADFVIKNVSRLTLRMTLKRKYFETDVTLEETSTSIGAIQNP